jgi:hypothetical protein
MSLFPLFSLNSKGTRPHYIGPLAFSSFLWRFLLLIRTKGAQMATPKSKPSKNFPCKKIIKRNPTKVQKVSHFSFVFKDFPLAFANFALCSPNLCQRIQKRVKGERSEALVDFNFPFVPYSIVLLFPAGLLIGQEIFTSFK